MLRSFVFLFFLCASTLNAVDHQSCLILLDRNDHDENIGQANRFYLMSRLQSAISEQATPILLHASLWNSFIERRTSFEQNSKKTLELYNKINERIAELSSYYNALSNYATHNKALIVQRINEEFYTPANKIEDSAYQLFLNHQTHFDPEEWLIYTNRAGFYLLIPKKNSHIDAFNIDTLEKVQDPQDVGSIYFESRFCKPLAEALGDFITCDITKDYAWTIVLSGHGGIDYNVINNDGTVTWTTDPIIASLPVQEFKAMLEFLHSKIKTHLLHYATCYGGGNYLDLIFKNSCYNFPIICDTLTDTVSYCKYANLLPSETKQYVTTADLVYDSEKKVWQLHLVPEYHWADFFKAIAAIDFSVGSIEKLHTILALITSQNVCNTSKLRLANATSFHPLYTMDSIVIDDRLQELASTVSIRGVNNLLVESSVICSTIVLQHSQKCRFISIKPGHAVHYFKKVTILGSIDFPDVIWQAFYQHYDKIFLFDELQFTHTDTALFKNIPTPAGEVLLKNIFVEQKNGTLRLFFTLGDKAVMVSANEDTIHEVVVLSEQAKKLYQEHYKKISRPLEPQESKSEDETSADGLACEIRKLALVGVFSPEKFISGNCWQITQISV